MDAVQIQFAPSSLLLINLILALMMFGVSLDLRAEDFRRIVREPRAPVIGLLAQFLLLPALTCLACWTLRIDPQLALGMQLVAACPGGSFSNIMTWMARGNVAVSVSMTAVSSLAAGVLTPLNFALYSWLNPYTRPLLTDIALDPLGLLLMVLLVLGLPLVLGMFIGRRFPLLTLKVEKPLRIFALLVMLAFVGLAFGRNWQQFLQHFHLFFWLVVAHNAMALLIGYGRPVPAARGRPPRHHPGGRHPELGAGPGDHLHLLPAGQRHAADRRLLGLLASGLRAEPGLALVA
jgi:BASS family bile acid:Na+ symporter